ALRATSSPRAVTASEQPGKAWLAMAFSRMRKGLRKRSSWAARLRIRKEKPDSRFGNVRFKGVLWTDGFIAKRGGRRQTGSYFESIICNVGLEPHLRRHVDLPQT